MRAEPEFVLPAVEPGALLIFRESQVPDDLDGRDQWFTALLEAVGDVRFGVLILPDGTPPAEYVSPAEAKRLLEEIAAR